MNQDYIIKYGLGFFYHFMQSLLDIKCKASYT